MTIRYGEYEAFCPGDQCPMANIGFYVEAEGYSNMPLGEPDMYAKLVCHNNQGKEFEKLEAKRTAILLPDENCIYKLSKALAESKSCPCDVGLADSAYCDEGWCKECWKNALSPEL